MHFELFLRTLAIQYYVLYTNTLGENGQYGRETASSPVFPQAETTEKLPTKFERNQSIVNSDSVYAHLIKDMSQQFAIVTKGQFSFSQILKLALHGG